jgi:NIPSNAP protein
MLTIKPRVWVLLTLAAGFMLGMMVQGGRVSALAGDSRVFELRTYTAADGKLNDLQARFRNHTTALFKKHGITNIGYWVPQDAPLSQSTLVYIIAYPNREEAKKRWAAFAADPDWTKARTASEVNGRLTSKVESLFMAPTDFSPMK